MKVTSPSLGIVSLVGASRDSCFLPEESVDVSMIRGGEETELKAVKMWEKDNEKKVRRVFSENIDRGRRKTMVVSRDKSTKGASSDKTSITLKAGKTSKG